MKIIAVCGSPRKGNTERILKEIKKGAEEYGATVEILLLRDIRIAECCGADECYYDGKCRINDRMKTEIYPKIISADAFIFATPNYFSNVSGIMKIFFDRTNPFAYKQQLKGKFAVSIVVGAHKKSMKKCENAIVEFCRIHGMTLAFKEQFIAEKAGDIENGDEKCRKLGKKMALFKKML